jgi:hypothetical protein
MPLKRIEECTLDDLFGLFEIDELTIDELKQAKKKVLMLHPDKNVGKDTSSYYNYFKNAYQKLETIFEYINRHSKKPNQEKTYQMEELGQKGFYEYCQKKGLKNQEFHKVFNEVFENVYLEEKEGHGEWLKTEEGIYDKTDLEGSRKKAMSIVVVDKEIKTLQETDHLDIKDAYIQSVLPIDATQVFKDTAKFNTVEEYQRHRANYDTKPISPEDALKILREKEAEEYKSSLHLSYELIKKSESQSAKMKEYYSKFLRIED